VRPGLTVTADITTDRRAGVLKVPISALVLRQAEEDRRWRGERPRRRGISSAQEGLTTVTRERDVEAWRGGSSPAAGEGDGKVVFKPVTAGARGGWTSRSSPGSRRGRRSPAPFILRELSRTPTCWWTTIDGGADEP
jgi:hypothetical protein